jgi:HTH-type transcriptional regulator/antitoxin HipB
MESNVNYSIKALSQLPLILKGFRKERGLTQAAMAEKLGVTQQSYAYFEANPATATLDRLFMVLRILNVEISLAQIVADISAGKNFSNAMEDNIARIKNSNQKVVNPVRQLTPKKNASSEVAAPKRVVSLSQTRESW